MRLFNADRLKELIRPRKEPCVSIYIPTHYEWGEKDQDRIRLKNQLQKIKAQLEEKKYDPAEIEKFLSDANLLYENEDFWRHTSRGLAMFISPNETIYYRLPIVFEEYSEVSSQYYIKPLLPLVSEDGRYFILTLDLKQSKLYHGSKFSISQVKLPSDIPTGLEEAMKLDDPEKSIQFHTGAGGSSGDRPAVFHGQGTGSDDKLEKKQILRFFQMLDKGIQEQIANENVPLVLIGVEFLIPIYKEANSYPYLIREAVDKNPDDLSPQEIHDQSWETIKPYFKKSEEKAVDEFGNKQNEDLASSKIDEVIKGSLNKRIDKLFINLDKQVWGRFDENNDQLIIDPESTPENEDLQDYAVRQTIKNNGIVFSLKDERMPNSEYLAAIFRYPTNQ